MEELRERYTLRWTSDIKRRVRHAIADGPYRTAQDLIFASLEEWLQRHAEDKPVPISEQKLPNVKIDIESLLEGKAKNAALSTALRPYMEMLAHVLANAQGDALVGVKNCIQGLFQLSGGDVREIAEKFGIPELDTGHAIESPGAGEVTREHTRANAGVRDSKAGTNR